MSKIHTTVRVGVDGSLTLPAFFMRGMGYEPGEEVHYYRQEHKKDRYGGD